MEHPWLKIREKKPGVVISNRGGWHSNELLFPVPESLQTLIDDIHAYANKIFANNNSNTLLYHAQS